MHLILSYIYLTAVGTVLLLCSSDSDFICGRKNFEGTLWNYCAVLEAGLLVYVSRLSF